MRIRAKPGRVTYPSGRSNMHARTQAKDDGSNRNQRRAKALKRARAIAKARKGEVSD